MIRRYLAATISILFFAYAFYLISYDGDSKSFITFKKLGQNVEKRFNFKPGMMNPSDNKSTDGADGADGADDASGGVAGADGAGDASGGVATGGVTDGDNK